MSVKRTKKYNQYIDAVLKSDVARATKITADATVAQAKALCPVDQGTLRRSIKAEKRGNDYAVVANAEYAKYVEFGTNPHTISIKNASVLTDGKRFFGKSVKHPGTKAQPFLRPAAILIKNKIVKMWRVLLGN